MTAITLIIATAERYNGVSDGSPRANKHRETRALSASSQQVAHCAKRQTPFGSQRNTGPGSHEPLSEAPYYPLSAEIVLAGVYACVHHIRPHIPRSLVTIRAAQNGEVSIGRGSGFE